VPDTGADLRDVPPKDCHAAVFEALDRGESLALVNDHEPKPLFYEMRAEVEAFDPDGDAVDRHGPEAVVATSPKR